MNRKISYFPGCSLATSAKENNESLLALCRRLKVDLVELPDWNCCGSSSAHSVNRDLAFDLAARNLSLAPAGRPLLAACPNCLLRLQEAHMHLSREPAARERHKKNGFRPMAPDLEILHFFELLDGLEAGDLARGVKKNLKGLSFVPYYGCMLARPPVLRREKNYHGLMERVLAGVGAQPLPWSHGARCCGTFLSVVRPDVVEPMVTDIMKAAQRARADCIVTACAMCHLNLEARGPRGSGIPILYFSELLSLAFGVGRPEGWFSRHLTDPRPLLDARGLL
ncbi:MAG: heterodisulfide reductase-related iron-sulfur binding cluster [Pseudomonadota bacterium]